VTLYGTILILYFGIIVVVGILSSKLMKDTQDFWVGGRTLGVAQTVATFVAAFISPASLLGLIGLHYGSGWGSLWMYGGTIGSMLVYTLWLAKKYRELGAVTIPDIFEWRYGKSARALGSLIITLGSVLYAAATAIGGGLVLEIAMGIPLSIGMTIMCVIFVLWCTLGGYMANSVVDIVHTIVKVAAFFLLFGLTLYHAGGFVKMNNVVYSANPELFKGFYSPMMIVAFFITWGFGNLGQPAYVARCFSAKSVRVASASFGVSALVLGVCYFISVAVGVGGRVFYPELATPDQLTLFLTRDFFPPIIGGVIYAAILGAGISVASSIILSGSTSFANDIYKSMINPGADDQTLLKVSRIATMVMGLLVIPLAVSYPMGIGMMTVYIFGIYASAIAAPILLGFLWPRYNNAGAMTTMIVATALAIIWQLLGQPSFIPGVASLHPAIPAFIFGSLSGVVVSLLTPATPSEKLSRFFKTEAKVQGEVL
jgi:SSS family transporter